MLQVVKKQQAHRCFSYDYREIKRLDMEFQRKLNLLRMYTEQKEFNYEQPEMIYDKKTGDVKIIDKSKSQKKTIIRNYDDLEKERALLLKEIDQKSAKPEDKVNKMASIEQRFQTEYEVDPSQFQVFSRDAMRVDVGLVI